MTYTSVLPSYWALKAIDRPSGEKWGLVSDPWNVVRRRASPPERGTIQISLAYAKAISESLTVG
jgi:hypothetical protein